MRLDADLMGRLAADEALWRDFNDICDCGGRLSGTESEKKAFALLRERVRAASPANSGRSIPVPYNGWQAKSATLKLPGGAFASCHPLVRTIATPGLTAEVIDLGRGTPDEFEAHKAEIAGRIVLVRHELMFAAGTIHRRRKYDMARANGAVGFLIGGRWPATWWQAPRAAIRAMAFQHSVSRRRPPPSWHAVRRAIPASRSPSRPTKGRPRPRRWSSTIPARPTNGSCCRRMSTAMTSPKARWTMAPASLPCWRWRARCRPKSRSGGAASGSCSSASRNGR